VDRRGAREVTATWVASYAGRATVTGTTSFDTADIRRLQVVRTDGGLLANVDVPQDKE
jgi:hypothetical protein